MLESSPSEYDENYGIPEQAGLPYSEGTGPKFSFAPEGNGDREAESEPPKVLYDLGTHDDNPMAAEMPSSYEPDAPDKPGSRGTIEPTTENLDSSPEEGTTEPLPIWVAVTATNIDSGGSCEVWLPQDFDRTTPLPDEDGIVELVIGGEPRKFLGSVIEMAHTLNTDGERHAAMGHDCGFFALAHQENSLPQDLLTPEGESLRVIWDWNTAQVVTDEAAIHPGDLVVLCNDTPDGVTPVHLMIRANTDQGSPVYAGKLGTMEPVILSTLDEIRKFYPTNGQPRVGGDLYIGSYQPLAQSVDTGVSMM